MPDLILNNPRLARRTLSILALLATCLVVGTLWHEVMGHGVAALACGGRIAEVELLGVRIYPRLHWLGWPQRYGACETAGVDGEIARQFVSLAGSLSTWSVAVLAVALLWLRRWNPWPSTLLTGLGIWWIDLFTYTLPSWGLRRSILWGQSHYSEPYEAAVALGVPGPVFQGFVVASSLLLGAALLVRMIHRRTRRDSATTDP